MDNKELEKITRGIFPEKKDFEIPSLLGFARKIEQEAQKEVLENYLKTNDQEFLDIYEEEIKKISFK